MFSFKKILFLIFTIILLSSSLYSTIINVPADQPTIQAGIDASANTDTVLVQPGTYVENINYNGKHITIGSLFLTTQDTAYISSTIIDGNSSGSVVTFENGEDFTAVLCGFIITNGYSGNGGGIYCSDSNPSIENVTITDNSAMNNGGGIYCSWSSPSIKNVTITDNSANWVFGDGGGIYCCFNSLPSLVNSILWNDFPQEIYYDSGMVLVTYSDIQGGWQGEGNIDLDPLFVDAGNGDFHLQSTSPCIDAGDPSSTYDPDGTIADMGAWFYNQGNDVEDYEIQNVSFNLSNYPNPFNPLTTISFDIKEYETGNLSIFNIKGQLIESHRFEGGQHNFQWDASNQASGVYLYKLQTEGSTVNKKMLLLK